nr:prepilin-type N-terminal cleavage/methylation domain-containing protein [Lysinibacillus timonensis]
MKKFVKELLSKRLNNEKGLTLIELLAVIVILAIVAAIAVPAIGSIINNSRVDAVKADAINALNAARLYFLDNPNDADNSVSVSELETAGFLDTTGNLTTDSTTAADNATISNTGGEYTISGTGMAGNNIVRFTDATIEDINGSGDSLNVTGT